MSRTLSWILLAFMLCSLVTWGSAFTPGAGKPQMGRREIPPRPSTEQVCCEHLVYKDVVKRLVFFHLSEQKRLQLSILSLKTTSQLTIYEATFFMTVITLHPKVTSFFSKSFSHLIIDIFLT